MTLRIKLVLSQILTICDRYRCMGGRKDVVKRVSMACVIISRGDMNGDLHVSYHNFALAHDV